MTTEHEHDAVRTAVRDTYAKAAEGGAVPGCCGPNPGASLQLGYTTDDLAGVPDGANLGLGCGNPQAIAALRAGEIVLDLGSGAGFDCFLAAKQVGPTGRILGVDMTPAMITKARANAARVQAENVEFRLGEIEHLPVADASARSIDVPGALRRDVADALSRGHHPHGARRGEPKGRGRDDGHFSLRDEVPGAARTRKAAAAPRGLLRDCAGRRRSGHRLRTSKGWQTAR